MPAKRLQRTGAGGLRLADPAGHPGRGPRAPCAWRKRLQARGYDIRAIRPPTVPEGTARLRLALTLHVTPADLDALFADLAAEMAQAMRFVVTGTDTDIGKTVFAAGLAGAAGRALLEAGAGRA